MSQKKFKVILIIYSLMSIMKLRQIENNIYKVSDSASA